MSVGAFGGIDIETLRQLYGRIGDTIEEALLFRMVWNEGSVGDRVYTVVSLDQLRIDVERDIMEMQRPMLYELQERGLLLTWERPIADVLRSAIMDLVKEGFTVESAGDAYFKIYTRGRIDGILKAVIRSFREEWNTQVMGMIRVAPGMTFYEMEVVKTHVGEVLDLLSRLDVGELDPEEAYEQYIEALEGLRMGMIEEVKRRGARELTPDAEELLYMSRGMETLVSPEKMDKYTMELLWFYNEFNRVVSGALEARRTITARDVRHLFGNIYRVFSGIG